MKDLAPENRTGRGRAEEADKFLIANEIVNEQKVVGLCGIHDREFNNFIRWLKEIVKTQLQWVICLLRTNKILL